MSYLSQGKPRSRTSIRLFRIFSLLAPPAFAFYVACTRVERGHVAHVRPLSAATLGVVGPLAALMLVTVSLRVIFALDRRTKSAPATALDHLDVLTASGSGLSWLASAAVVAAMLLGWPSFSVLGLVGLSLLHLAVIWTSVVVGGDDPMRSASLSRSLAPQVALEGAPITETLRLSNPRVPPGFRLFIKGRVAKGWPVARYAIDDTASRGEVMVERELENALRGEHDAEPLELWLQDVFGLCHSVSVRAGSAKLTVLPRTTTVHGVKELLDRGGHDLATRPVTRMPTEGAMRLREYQPGDDARRIHWTRSLAAQQIVVRLPDELPPDRPAVRLVLDTYFADLSGLEDTRAPGEMLDALVKVWLSVGRSLLATGARVTMVTAVRRGDGVTTVARPLNAQTLPSIQRLAAELAWQDAMLPEQLGETAALVVSCRTALRNSDTAPPRILVSEAAWVELAPRPAFEPPGLHPHPSGSADNRWSRRRAKRVFDSASAKQQDAFAARCASSARPRKGDFFARPVGTERIELEVVS
jgi:uncharacterized protein (DUF58 family)